MKRSLLKLLLSFIGVLGLVGQVESQDTIRITSPASSVRWVLGFTKTISWTTVGSVPRVKIEVGKGNNQGVVAAWTVIAADTANTGSFNWVVAGDTGRNYVKVMDATDSIPVAQSRAFTISRPYLSFLRPTTTMETIEKGQPYTIRWFSEGTSPFVKIMLSIDTGKTWTSITDSTENDSSFTWTTPNLDSLNYCYLKLYDLKDTTINVRSSRFSLSKPFIKISYPAKRTILDTGMTATITWSKAASIPKVKIELSSDSGVTWSAVTSATGVDSTLYSWKVPPVISGKCQLRLSDAADNDPVTVTDSVFSIVAPKLALISPVNGDSLDGGLPTYIQWSKTTSITDTVKVEYSANNGQSWDSLGKSRQTYINWTVPVAPVAQAKIRITTIPGGRYCDSVTFTINPVPTIKVLTPKSGDSVRAGDTCLITWTSTGIKPTALIRLRYALDVGSNFTRADSFPNTGSYKWPVPFSTSQKDSARLLLYELPNGYPTDTMVGYFKIIAGTPILPGIKKNPLSQIQFSVSSNPVDRNMSVPVGFSFVPSKNLSNAQLLVSDAVGNIVYKTAINSSCKSGVRYNFKEWDLKGFTIGSGAYSIIVRVRYATGKEEIFTGMLGVKE